MGTRSETIIYANTTPICKIYRQMDGYPDCHGIELATACNVMIVNGLSGNTREIANGMGCLAAQVIKALKTGPGSIYLFDPTQPGDEEYVYEVRGTVGAKPTITCRNGTVELFTNLPADEALAWCGTPR